MIDYKVDIIDELKKAGYSTYRLRSDKLLSESTIQKFRNGDTTISLDSLDTVCKLLNCQPSDIISYRKKDK